MIMIMMINKNIVLHSDAYFLKNARLKLSVITKAGSSDGAFRRAR